MVKYREEEVYEFRKRFKKILIQRKFVKESSVFAYWITDTPATIAKCFEYDMKFWKCKKFIKDKDDYNDLKKSVKRNYEFIKANHLALASTSTFPATSINDFTLFSTKAGFTDKTFNNSRVDQLFIATNFEEEAQDENPDKALIRFEFIELLVRIAREKY